MKSIMAVNLFGFMKKKKNRFKVSFSEFLYLVILFCKHGGNKL